MGVEEGREQPLVLRLAQVVELLADPLPQLLDERVTSWLGTAILSSDRMRATLPRSAEIASAMPGYCTLTATARPSAVMARCTWPIDAAAMGSGSH